MPKRISRKRTSQRYRDSSEDIRQIALKVICSENNRIFKEGDIDEIVARYRVSEKTTPNTGLYEEVASAKEEALDEVVSPQDILTLPSLEEPVEQYQPQPEALSFPNFIAEPISMGLRHLACSSTHITAIDNMTLGRTSAMPVSNFSSTVTDPTVMSGTGQMPVLSSTHTSSTANENHIQGAFYRPWQTSFTPRCINGVSTAYFTTALQRQASFSNAWGLPGPMGFGGAYNAPPTGYADPVVEYNTGINNTYGSSQQHQMNISQPGGPHPWELQRPRGFSRVETQTTNRMVISNDEAGPSDAIPSAGEDQKLQHFMFALGMIPTNPSDALAKRFKLVDTPQTRRTRSGQAYSTQGSIQKLVINDTPIPGASSSITGGPVYRCQMCDDKIDPDVCKTADHRFCPDCYFYVYGWK